MILVCHLAQHIAASAHDRLTAAALTLPTLARRLRCASFSRATGSVAAACSAVSLFALTC